MLRTKLALVVLIALGGCQDSGKPPTTAERCSTIDMQIAAAEENDQLQQGAKVEMIESLKQEKIGLNCP